MHARLIEAFGGTSGLRDPGALEAALMRPQLGYYRDLIEGYCQVVEPRAL